jgi:multisubunit Na+/H+ antiporter MnhC subunit
MLTGILIAFAMEAVALTMAVAVCRAAKDDWRD